MVIELFLPLSQNVPDYGVECNQRNFGISQLQAPKWQRTIHAGCRVPKKITPHGARTVWWGSQGFESRGIAVASWSMYLAIGYTYLSREEGLQGSGGKFCSVIKTQNIDPSYRRHNKHRILRSLHLCIACWQCQKKILSEDLLFSLTTIRIFFHALSA